MSLNDYIAMGRTKAGCLKTSMYTEGCYFSMKSGGE